MSSRSLNWSLLKTSVKIDMHYRFRVLIWMAMSAIWVMVYPVVWLAVYGDRTELSGFSRSDLLTYFIGILVMEYLAQSYVDEDMHEEIREGKISALLLKPVHFVRYFFFVHIGYKLLPLGVYAVLITLGVSVLDIPFSLPTQWYTLPVFACTVVIGHLIAYNLKMILACAAFWIEEAEPLRVLYWIVCNLFMGWMGPLVFFPLWFQQLSTHLPWQYTAYFPIMIFLENVTVGAMTYGIAVSVVWLGIAVAVRHVVVRYSIRRYNAVGS